jgi:formiminoglutamase
LHESYTSKNVLDKLKSLKERVLYNTYDALNIRREKEFRLEMQIAIDFIKSDAYGVEIDLDSLPMVPTSAMTPSGFSVEEVRQFVYFFGKHTQAAYLHICEGAPALDFETNKHMVGKLIGYLVTDFIKAKNSLD